MRPLQLPSIFYHFIRTGDETYRPGADNLAVEYSITKGHIYSYADDSKKQIPRIIILPNRPYDIYEKALIRRLSLQGFIIQPMGDLNQTRLDPFLQALLADNDGSPLHTSSTTPDEWITLCANQWEKKTGEVFFLSEDIFSELKKNESDILFLCDITDDNQHLLTEKKQWVITEFDGKQKLYVFQLKDIFYDHVRLASHVFTEPLQLPIGITTDHVDDIIAKIRKSIAALIIDHSKGLNFDYLDLQKLKKLTIDVKDANLNDLFSRLKIKAATIESLSLTANTTFTVGNIPSFRFKKISISGSIAYQELCLLLEKSSHLETLTLRNCVIENIPSKISLEKMSKLKKLIFFEKPPYLISKALLERSYDTVEEVMIGTKSEVLLPDRIFPKLNKLTISESTLILCLIGANKLSDQFPTLSSLTITKGNFFALSGKMGYFPSLKILNLQGCDSTLEPLLKTLENCPNLHSLDLRNCIYLPSLFQKIFTGEALKAFIVEAKKYLAREVKQNSSYRHKLRHDADTVFSTDTVNEREIFYAREEKDNPSTTTYRLATYNKLGITAEKCKKSQAFILSNDDDHAFSDGLTIPRATVDLYEKLKASPPDKSELYYGKINITLTNTWQPLPSLFPDEVLTDYHLKDNIAVEIKYSQRDSLYYIRHTENIAVKTDIDFLIQRPRSKSTVLPDHIKNIVTFVSSFGVDTAQDIPDNLNGYDYLKRMIDLKVGACRHRAIVFMHLLSKSEAVYAEKTPVRYISNDSHAYVEINIQGTWVTCDLGGYAADSIIDRQFQPNQTKKQVTQVKPESTLSSSIPLLETQKTSSAKPSKRKESTFFKSCVSEKAVSVKPSIIPPLIFETALSSGEINQLIDQIYPPPLMPKTTKKTYFSDEKPTDTIPVKRYLEKLCHGDSDRYLLKMSGQSTGFTYHLQKYCHDTHRPLFYVNHPDDLICAAPIISKKAEGTGEIIHGPGGKFYHFLQAHYHEAPIIIINFDHFTEEDKVKFNTLLDDVKAVDGVILPPQATIIGMLDTTLSSPSKDTSFYSRFGEQVQTLPYSAADFPLPMPFSSAGDNPYQINLYGSKQWESILTGSWYLNGRTPCFQEGQLIEAIRQGYQNIVFVNPPDDPNFERFFREIQLYGVINSQGESISVPAEFRIATTVAHNFSDINGTYTYSFPPENALVLNESLLLSFFYRDLVDNDNNLLIRQRGILEENAGKTVTLYVNDVLSDDQWERLFDHARKHHVTVNLYLSEKVTLPLGLNLSPNNQESTPVKSEHTVFIKTVDRDLSLALLKQEYADAVLIDISELSASDLIKKVSAFYNKETLAFIFSETDMFLLKALREEKTIVLHGDITPALANQLTPLLLKRNYDPSVKSQLVFISENDTPFNDLIVCHEDAIALEEKEKQKDPSKKGCHLQAEAHSDVPWIGMRTSFPAIIPKDSLELTQADQKSSDFNKARINLVQSMLAKAPYVFLAGATGIGKTSFVEKYWHNPAENRIVYREHEFEKWVLDDQEAVIKTLFIDEATLTQKNWSQFEGLFFDPPSILLGDKVVPLSKNHKIIFAGNPISYSDDRHLPSLFERHGNAVPFHPLPAYYVFHEMLEPLFKGTAWEKQADMISQPVLAVYHALLLKSDREVLITPREMTMAVMLTIAYCDKHKQADPVDVAKYFAYELTASYDANTVATLTRPPLFFENSRFLITPSNQNHAHLLQDFLTLRDFRQYHPALSNQQRHAGLGAFVLEGDPGLGKSVMMRAMLLANHFKEHHLFDPLSTENIFYTAPVTFSLQMRKEILIKAYFEGAVVIWDEMNCGASMEKFLNDLMMGKIPSDPFVATLIKEHYANLTPKPGFLILGTQNAAEKLEGRHETSLAIQHRSHKRTIDDYPLEEKEMVLTHLGLPLDDAKAMINDYEKKAKAQQLTFRHLTKKAKYEARACHELQEQFTQKRLLHEEKIALYKLLLTSETTPPAALQALAKEVTSAKILYCIARHTNANETVYQALLHHAALDQKTLSWMALQTHNRNLLYQIIHHPKAHEAIKQQAMKKALEKQATAGGLFSMHHRDLKERLVFILEMLNVRYDGKRVFLREILHYAKLPNTSAAMIIAEISKQIQLDHMGQGRMHRIFTTLDQQLKKDSINIDIILSVCQKG